MNSVTQLLQSQGKGMMEYLVVSVVATGVMTSLIMTPPQAYGDVVVGLLRAAHLG